MLDRREFLAGVAAFPFLSCSTQAISLGSAKLTTISDGSLVLPGRFIFEPMPQDALTELLDTFKVDKKTLVPECNVVLFQDDVNTVLFDVGSGPDFMPSSGKLLENLELAGVTPQDVTHVVFTHAHPDHIWGLLDDFDELVFSNAAYLMGRTEWDYWWNPETVVMIGEARAAFAVGAKRRMEYIENAVQFFDSEQEILPGIQAIATYGHTLGHMSFEIRKGNESLIIAGDAIGNHHVAFVRPEWPSGSDQEQDLAVLARKMLLDRIFRESMILVGFHLPHGGIGRVEKTSEAYRFVQDTLQ